MRERRDLTRRAELVKQFSDAFQSEMNFVLTVPLVQEWFGIPADAAKRLLARISAAGLMRQVNGVWIRVPIAAGDRSASPHRL